MKNKIKSEKSLIILLGIITFFSFCLISTSNSKYLTRNQIKYESEFSNADTFKCVTEELNRQMIKDDPDYKKRLDEIEEFTKNYIKNLKSKKRSVVTIPVVVHIVYNTSEQNISNAKVQSQIDVLNKDFRRLNSDTVNTPAPFKPLGGDSQIEFKLAKRDPNGNPSNGITRTLTSIPAFIWGTNHGYVMFTSMGGYDIWDRNKYLNIWVCNLSGARGFTQYPGGNASSDGSVIGYKYFGTIGELISTDYNKGRTGTHEIGHWFNLRHIWGESYCGSDSVDDTPTQDNYNLGCPTFPHISCSNGPNGDMFMNYMDYSSDNCMNIFSIGQCNRMNATLYGIRSSLLTSNGCIPVSGVPVAHFRSDKMIINPGQNIIFFDESGGIPTSWQWTFDGGTPSTSNLQNPAVTYQNSGLYNVKLKVSNSFGTDSVNYVNYVKVLGLNMLPFSLAFPPSNTFINTNASDTSKSIFTWTKSGTYLLIDYKWKIRKDGTINDYIFSSNNNGVDTLISLQKSFLDSLAVIIGGNVDTLCCIWRVYAYNGSDSLASQNQNFIFFVRNTVGIKVISSDIPSSYSLFQNYPNPFNPTTMIKFDIPKESFVSIKVYDITGREMKTLVNEIKGGGSYSINFDGSELSNGVYFYKIQAGDFSEVKKMILLK